MSLENVFVISSSKSTLKPFGIRAGHAHEDYDDPFCSLAVKKPLKQIWRELKKF